MSSPVEDKPGIIGRERALMERLAEDLHTVARLRHDYTALSETRRGYRFEVNISGSDGKPTNRIASVVIELDRVEET